jgi:hypothetical protein
MKNAHTFLLIKGIVGFVVNYDKIKTPLMLENLLTEFAEQYNVEEPQPLRPLKGLKVKWKGYDCKVQRFKVRDRIAKIVQDHDAGCHTMPYQYFWVEWDEIGFN